MASDPIVTITSENFNSVINSGKLVMVDFWAVWCGPCRMVAPFLQQIAEERGDSVVIAKLNVDDEQALAMQYQVSSIPTFILFKDGKVVDRMIGAMPKNAFNSFIDRNL